jgi:hypothetical protein
MLIQFLVENFRSFRDEVVFSMRAASHVERGESAPDVVTGTNILRCAALYGANASGKSNFVKALRFAQNLIVHGVSERGRIRTQTFRLDPTRSEVPARFEFYVRVQSGKVYGYGFAVRPEAVVSEWLCEVEGDDEREVFSRQGKDFTFAGELESDAQEFLTVVSGATRDNQLLLRTALEFKLERFPEPIQDVLAWFDELAVILPEARYGSLVREADKHEDFRAFLGDVLRRADTGISALRTVRRELTKAERSALDEFIEDGGEAFDIDLSDRRRAYFAAEGDDWYRVELRLEHGGAMTEAASEFGLDDESDGTVRLLDLAPILFHAQKPRIFVVDELDRSMHTALTRWLVERFISEGAGTTSQLIFTTHDTNLLDLPSLRPDAIWFAEKDTRGASTLYSLAEFKKEQIHELCGALEQGYLDGRFGAVPFLAGPKQQ